MRCRICASKSDLRWNRGDVALYRCLTCGFVTGKPLELIEPERRYEHYYDRAAPPAPEARYHQWLAEAEALLGNGRLLEIGAGRGAFVRAALARGWTVDATEVSKSALNELGATGATVFFGDVTAARYPVNQFDLVASLEVLEHLPEPLPHLCELARITRPGGALLLTTPNFNGFSRRWLGVRWRVIDPEHLCYFTPSTLSFALLRAGYREARVASRYLDVLSWRRGAGPAGSRPFEPHIAAKLRDAVEARTVLRFAKKVANTVLNITGLGDSLLVWARR